MRNINVNTRVLTLECATELYLAALDVNQAALQPSKQKSGQDKGGRWVLRNINGFLAYVTTHGKVLNRSFQPIGEA